jgi:hypothetical protein
MRIGSIYEGTNGIQAMDLVGRKLPMRMGGVVADFIKEMRSLDLDLQSAGDEFTSMRKNLASALDVLAETTTWIMTNGLTDPKEALAGATPYLRMFGIVVAGWLMARQALAAHDALESGSDDAAFLEAKIATARYYADQHLPQASGLVAAVTAGSADLYAIGVDELQSV